MQPEGRERRKEHSSDEEFQGLAVRSLREGVPVDKLDLRLKNPDGTPGPDVGRVDELRVGAKEKLLAMAGLSPEQVAAVLKVEKEGGGSTRAPAAEPEAAPQAPEKVLTADERLSLLSILEARFTSAPEKYKNIEWPHVKRALEAVGDKALYGLFRMEKNGHAVGVTRVEKDRRNGFRFDSWSKESPADIRDVDYFQAEKIAEKDWGVSLMSPEVFEDLRVAGIITNKTTWDYLKTENPGTPEKPGLAWSGYNFGISEHDADVHNPRGGFRCSLWIPEV